MRITVSSRALALFMSVQPIWWMPAAAFAQTIGEGTARESADRAPFSGRSTGEQGLPPDEFSRDELSPPAQSSALPEQSAPVAIDEPLDPNKYVLGHGDVLELNFWGVQNVTLRAVVDLEGRLFIPKVGYFKVGGRTLTAARTQLTSAVARYYRLTFDMSVAQPRAFLVQVVGAVRHPGAYSARAVERVSVALRKAGGLGERASSRRIEIQHRDGSLGTADLQLFQQSGDVKYDPYLLDGDVVRVPFEDLVVEVSGAVNRPGRYELVGSRDMKELTDLAGGVSSGATEALPVQLIRRGPDDRQNLTSVYMKDGWASTPLEREDRVKVPSFQDVQQSVLVVGAIGNAATIEDAAASRRLSFVQGDTVGSLIERAGGAGPQADLATAYVIRGSRVVPVNLFALILEGNRSADQQVELGDTVVVPFRRRGVLVEGAVFAPGTYPYNPSFKVPEYLALAGGPNRFAQDLESVRLVSPTGEMKPYSPGLTVEPGSALVVPERNFSRAEIVQIGLSVAGILLSGVAVVLAVR
ncbi:MAG: SLBB domain-containing protein [Anaeromyxobacter sp.]